MKYGITDGLMVRVSSMRGYVDRIAKVSEDTRQGLLVAEGIFWEHPEGGTGVNDLTSQKTTDIAEGPTFHESLVKVESLR